MRRAAPAPGERADLCPGKEHLVAAGGNVAERDYREPVGALRIGGKPRDQPAAGEIRRVGIGHGGRRGDASRRGILGIRYRAAEAPDNGPMRCIQPRPYPRCRS